MFALIFGVGLLTGKSYYGPADVKSAGVVPNLREVADQFKQAVDLRVGSTATPADAAAVAVTECAGRPNEWNPTQLQMVVRPPLHPVVNGQAEVAVWVPDNVRVAFDANEYSAGQLLLIPARVAENGEWQASLQWRALRPGRFDAWVETRCGGLYLHRPIVFHAITP